MTVCQNSRSSQDAEQVYALVLNTEGNALICQTEADRPGHVWSIPMTCLPDGHDPVQAAQQTLFQLGYESQHWFYLGSFIGGENQIVHFLFARNAYRVRTSPFYNNGFRWVCPRDLRYALLDGRITKVGDATTVALAMYLMEPHKTRDTAVSPTYVFPSSSPIRTDA